MRTRHLPKLWLMTDERQGDGLWAALERLPRGSGVVFRHHATPTGERRRLFAAIARIAKRRGLLLVRAGAEPMRGEGGGHNRKRRAAGLTTWSIHNARDAVAARRVRADLAFVSPVCVTRSHPGARTLGSVRLGLLLRHVRIPAVALGGMDPQRFRRVRGLGLYGWAAIDAWAVAAAAKPRRQS